MKVLNLKSVYTIFLIFFISYDNKIYGKPIDEDDPEDAAVTGMRIVEKEAAADIPRNVFAQLLQRGKFFQDIFSEQQAPHKLQFGHVCENPSEWEQRFEEKDLKMNRHQGKVRWGNKNGGYGEHYWDLNHGGSSNDEEEVDEE